VAERYLRPTIKSALPYVNDRRFDYARRIGDDIYSIALSSPLSGDIKTIAVYADEIFSNEPICPCSFAPHAAGAGVDESCAELAYSYQLALLVERFKRTGRYTDAR
jgi:fatty acid-binding protein DegV